MEAAARTLNVARVHTATGLRLTILTALNQRGVKVGVQVALKHPNAARATATSATLFTETMEFVA